MVSYDTRRFSSLGYWIFGHPETCSGDQSSISLLTTVSRSGSWMARRHSLGRRADSHTESASLARYSERPPCRATSLLTVEAARLRPAQSHASTNPKQSRVRYLPARSV